MDSVVAATYHVPLFMLGAPLVAVFFSLLSPRWPLPLPSVHGGRRRKQRALQCGPQAAGASPAWQREWPLWGISAVFLLASTPWLVFKESAPLLKHSFPATIVPKPIFSTSREELYFNHIGGRGWPTYTDFVHLVDFVASQEPEVVGLYERYEPDHPTLWFQAYALYMMLKERLEDVSVEYFGVANRSASLATINHAPSIILLRTRSRDNRNLDSLDGLIARRIFTHRANRADMEAWQPVRPFGGTLRTVDMTQLKPEHQRFVCDQFHRQTGSSRAFFLGRQLIYLPVPSATAVVDAACKQQEPHAGAESSAAVPTEHIVLHATFHNNNGHNNNGHNDNGAQTTNDASRFELRVQEYRGSLGALAFDVPAQVASISIAELDSAGRVKWQTELAVPDTDAPI